MYLCYIDESGTSQIPGNTSHFILAGLAIPIEQWKSCESDIERIKAKYELRNSEIHTGWILRKYLEQKKIPDFDKLNYSQRRFEVENFRNAELLRILKSNNKSYRQVKKNFYQTNKYVHLTYEERVNLIEEIAAKVGGWGEARLFAECIDKIHFCSAKHPISIDEQAFEQIVTRFEHFLKIKKEWGILIHDNNETIAKKHTKLMKEFHRRGTFWTSIENIIETPLFVDSQLTSMVQIADVCAYSLRRYAENQEETIFKQVFKRADKKDGKVVGIRHYAAMTCGCKMCLAHRV